MKLFLQSGARIGIIGGGPSGSFTAIHLLTAAKLLDKKFEVFIFDKKDFTSVSGCNFCAGILSNTLIKELLNHGIAIPPKIIQSNIKGYYYETIDGTAYFPKPSTSSIVSVFRANGPFISKELLNISFDYFLQQESIKRGAIKLDCNIDKIIFPSKPNERIILYAQNQNKYFEFDMVFGAFGINTYFAKRLEKSNIGYKAPQYLHSGQVEIPYDICMNKKFRDNITIFLIPFKGIYFFSFTPKSNYLTVTAIGPHVKKSMLEEIFKLPQVLQYFPEKWQLPINCCHCHPRIPITTAKNPFSNRFVIVGDACWSRYLKDGITSAFYTSKLGVDCALKHGISREAFKNIYYKNIIQMDKDNFAGKLLFKIHDKSKRSHAMGKAFTSMILDSSHKTIQENTRYILWGLFTGDYSYKKIMRKILEIPLILHFIKNVLAIYIKNLSDYFRNLKKNINLKNK